MSGADLANVTNEGALMAARQGKKKIDFSDFNKVKSEIIFLEISCYFYNESWWNIKILK